MIARWAEAVSLTLTIPGLFICLLLLYYWLPHATEAVTQRERSAAKWITIGVTISFVGSFFDNLYWYAAWAASFTGWHWQGVLFANGVYFNIPFRQTALLMAGFCHLRAVDVYLERSSNRLNWQVILSTLAGIAITVTLFYVSTF